jgi:hypothetical protein
MGRVSRQNPKGACGEIVRRDQQLANRALFRDSLLTAFCLLGADSGENQWLKAGEYLYADSLILPFIPQNVAPINRRKLRG